MNNPARPANAVSPVILIAEVFQVLSLKVSNEAVAKYLLDHHSVIVRDRQIELVRDAIAAEE